MGVDGAARTGGAAVPGGTGVQLAEDPPARKCAINKLPQNLPASTGVPWDGFSTLLRFSRSNC